MPRLLSGRYIVPPLLVGGGRVMVVMGWRAPHPRGGDAEPHPLLSPPPVPLTPLEGPLMPVAGLCTLMRVVAPFCLGSPGCGGVAGVWPSRMVMPTPRHYVGGMLI